MNRHLRVLTIQCLTIVSTLLVPAISMGQDMNCPETDLSSQLGPVRDQEEDGICHVASSSTLVTQLLNATKLAPDFLPSWLDAMNCADQKVQLFHLPNQGGNPLDSLQCMLGKGVCEEHLAPYDHRVYLDCREEGAAHRCASPALRRTCAEKEEQAKLEKQRCDGPSTMDGPLREFVKDSLDVPAHHKGLCSEGPSYVSASMNCLRDQLIGEGCRQGRLHLPNRYAPVQFNLANKSDWERKASLCEILGKGRALGLALCLNKIAIPAVQKMMGFFKQTSADCQGAHGVVVAGSKMIHGTLHFYIRNSWGANSPFEGWVPAETLYPSMLYATFIGDKSP